LPVKVESVIVTVPPEMATAPPKLAAVLFLKVRRYGCPPLAWTARPDGQR
jgi:hypothetical protein